VGISLDAKGKPDFQTFGEGKESVSVVLPAAYGIPKPVTMAYVKAAHVGNAFCDSFDRFYDDAKEWAAAWDKIKAGAKEANPEVSESAAVPSNLDAETVATLSSM
jgi:hypothetical protein